MDTVQYYKENASEYIRKTQNIDMTSHYKLFLKYLKPGDSILDIGFGSGRDSIYFSKNYSVTSIDVVNEFIEHAKSIGLLNVYFQSVQDMMYKNDFDAIWACASLLHIKKQELNTVFKKCYKALKQNGYMYCSFKYGDFTGEIDGKYYIFLTEKTIKEFIINTGFDMIEYVITDDLFNRETKWLNIILCK
ncbi:MAG: tellurite resistance protein TehB [Firmicutes bacterium ADurb.Bin146]|nr:MAG: tellurite resistance protein TehB [Firmicutes bacterium ADurb.Bin146]